MTVSRREFLKGAGSLVVSLGPLSRAAAQNGRLGQFATHASHIDPDKLDSWIAVNGDGSVTAYTGNAILARASLQHRHN
jgi:hypothetical protein